MLIVYRPDQSKQGVGVASASSSGSETQTHKTVKEEANIPTLNKADYLNSLGSSIPLVSTSGLTPPTAYIIQRRFRPEVHADLKKAESAISSIIGGGVLEWMEEINVTEDDFDWRMAHEPGTVWEPDDQVMQDLWQAGEIDQDGELLEDNNIEE